ncbi:MAG: Glyoxylate/hydroxypyruvate reductase [Pseudomonadota bacterium]|jgi:lactate dehydrogenase-like 2-hydroxyacid dehydrogenase
MSIHHPEIVVTSRIPPFLTTGLQEKYVVHERDHIRDRQVFGRVRALVGGGESKIDASYMALFPALEMISVCGVGYDGIDVAAAKKRGIMVSHTPEVLNDDVADLALGLLLAVARKIPAADRFTRNADWLDGPFPLTRKLTGAKLGIVGMGRIGQAIAKRAAAFDMDISYNTRHQRSDVPYKYVPNVSALAAAVDFLVVITPGGSATRNLINAEVLKALGPQGFLVNVARGSVVDQVALIEALQKKTIAGAGLDVYVDEPNVPAELRKLDNVVLTPHVASGTVETRKAMSALALANLDAHMSGQPIMTPVPECRP